MGLLRAGATLILDAVDEMHSPIGLFAEDLARELHEEVQVNAYGLVKSRSTSCRTRFVCASTA